jgi:trimeric autotransporter adhesin
MRCLLFCLLLPFVTQAQIVTRFAGSGIALGDGGPATAAQLPDPTGMRFDTHGNLFVGSGTGNRIRKIDASGIITTIAGRGAGAYSGDGGQATAANIKFPADIALDASGNVFFTDFQNNAIRKIDIATGIITTICGDGTMASSGDNNPATAAQLYGPHGLCFDKTGNLYVGCDNHVVRKINTAGIISNFAGIGTAGYNGDGIAATTAQLYFPQSIDTDDSGNVYISDVGNYRIRKVNKSGIITTYAGNGGSVFSGDGTPATSVQFVPAFIRFGVDKNLYVTHDGSRISKIDNAGIFHVIAGTGVKSNTGDGGPASAATFDHPIGIAVDECDNIYVGITTSYNGIRKITYNANPCAYLSAYAVNAFKLVIYPNPAYDAINVDNIQGTAVYRLTNMLGIMQQRGILKAGNNSISIQLLPAGIYMLEVSNNEASPDEPFGRGQRTIMKIVKQ